MQTFQSPFLLLFSLSLWACSPETKAPSKQQNNHEIQTSQSPDQAKAKPNLEQEADLPKLVFDGVYQQRDSNKILRLDVLQASPQRLQFALSLESKKTETIQGFAALVAQTAKYKTNIYTGQSCDLILHFDYDFVRIEQYGQAADCGGKTQAGNWAGTYHRQKEAKPRL